MTDILKEIRYVKGVGNAKAVILQRLGIYTLKDLITYYPRSHEDRSKVRNIIETKDSEEVLIEGILISNVLGTKLGKKTIQKVIVQDETGILNISWFNQTYLKNKLHIGQKIKIFGKISIKYGRYYMTSPKFDEENKVNNTGKIVPIYKLTKNISQNVIRKLIENGIKEVYGHLEEQLPKYIIDRYKLLDINSAVLKIHFPNNFEEYKQARRRLVFEELFSMQLALLKLKNEYNQEIVGNTFLKEVKIEECKKLLPFTLTNAQNRVINEIEKNMEQNVNMNRLLQGDVGSGKTVIAVMAAYKAVKSGYQVAILAPTAILAKQHLDNFKKVLQQVGIEAELLISGITKKNKAKILDRLKNGEIDILIGTHAILEDNVIFKKLGLVITDEQHRFGVKQRTKIASKGQNPDIIVMSATPIPRTLALILYGDLDISIIDELPPNRKQIETFAVGSNMTERIYSFIQKNVDEGRQCYVVCPLVEENEEIDLISTEKLYKMYKEEIFKDYFVECIHGKMKSKDKDSIMERFKNKEIDILISTTVIEVGVDVPNANVMVIENAERFGLAQLHQLRGRVGRGEFQSYCILKYEGKGINTKERMKVMCETNDGFIISEKDLELRGSGDFFGTMQHGLPEFKIANLFTDIEILKEAQKTSEEILEEDPVLHLEKNIKLNTLIEDKFKGRIEI